MVTKKVLKYWFPAKQIKLVTHTRGSSIGFSGSGIWLFERSGFGILGEKSGDIRN